MKSEIDKDFYCSSYDDPNDCHGFDNQNTDGCFKRKYYYKIGNRSKHRTGHCKNCHRKHPTPEQFREEYGEEYPDDGAVYYLDGNDTDEWWDVDLYSEIKSVTGLHIINDEKIVLPAWTVVCACTPFGKPDKDWRPE